MKIKKTTPSLISTFQNMYVELEFEKHNKDYTIEISIGIYYDVNSDHTNITSEIINDVVSLTENEKEQIIGMAINKCININNCSTIENVNKF